MLNNDKETILDDKELIYFIEEYIKKIVTKLELNLLNSDLFKLDIFNKIKNEQNNLTSLKLNEISNQFIPGLKKNLCLGFFEDIYKKIVLDNIEFDNLKDSDLKEIYLPINYLKTNTDYNYVCLLTSIYEITINFLNYLDINQPSFKSQADLKDYIKNFSYDFFSSKFEYNLEIISNNNIKYSNINVFPKTFSQLMQK
jgi:hypothetical protein